MEDFLAPKYYLLKKEIVHQIDNEVFKDGELIPSERELVQKYGVSRITVRRAIDELVSEGYLYRVQGKGTFVKSNLLEQNIITLNSITQDIIAMNKKPRRIVNRVEIAPSFPKRTKELEINPNDKLIIIDRLYLGDDEPVTRTISYIPYKYFRD
jgi:GntR family transcriptional regulator